MHVSRIDQDMFWGLFSCRTFGSGRVGRVRKKGSLLFLVLLLLLLFAVDFSLSLFLCMTVRVPSCCLLHCFYTSVATSMCIYSAAAVITFLCCRGGDVDCPVKHLVVDWPRKLLHAFIILHACLELCDFIFIKYCDLCVT